ncbi:MULTISPECIES: hypothetical protein [unclassified Mucilaginibacter]|uniref:hypothetical protein n=1 Tax=unclassified Mucilaginibacter TaxID=2617802 RepID=UPI002AC949E7|nr:MULTISPECIES: hypothetical protein [unclassified Mucilaginibacter]MEB0261483.1 hypothetical protein [Mucilaginibacter sp. 10I4]MEB0276931.1 hypothetical protein [Mucilaginibacter sp. 10B2]MEB0300749.1 hypothetical protein [Mucilaginibacter sp. 5C4]WPX25031.1 hypothetical protein RHM67_07110 [Mucilaginibacter sp. 5C4]
MKQNILVLLVLSALFSCNPKPQKATLTDNKTASATVIKTDTASLRKLLEKSQKPGVDIAEILFNGDTLKIITGTPDLYYPFGKHSNVTNIKQSIVHSSVKNIYLINWGNKDSTAITQISTAKSIIKFYKSDETTYQEIVSANIFDNNFHFLNNIHIGMSKEELLALLFNKTPSIAVNFIKLISTVDGIQHYYIFKNNKLIEIKIVTDYTFTGK